MDHVGDGQPPAGDASPDLPTEIEWSYRPAQDAYPDLPTEIERPYQPAHDARPYLPTEIEWPHKPAEDARPPAHGARPPAHGARPPADDARPYPPATHAGSAYQATHTGSGEPAVARPSYTPSHARPADQPARADQSARAGRPDPAPELTRYGPGVPAIPPTGAAQTAERIWVTGRPDQPPRRPRRWRGLAGAALTVILLAASAVLLFLRFHHAPFDVTSVKITQRTQSGCGVNVTGQINTNGAAGTVSYQWLFQPDQQAPQPLSQSVVAGHNTVYVTVAVQGSGHGSASRRVTLQVLGPDRQTASTSVVLRC